MTRHDEMNPENAQRNVVYIRKVRPEEMPEGAPDTPLFSIHDASSARIGVAPARDLAFIAARRHDLTPVSVH